jgi:glycosyltransferase involved in cell wall biosynthesis
MKNPKISVCIPSYNHEKYIGKTIESILNQTYENFEIIISDDNSKDNSENIIKSYKDQRITFYKNNNNIGPGLNPNKLIELSSCDYILMISSDDMLREDALEIFLKEIEIVNGADVLFCYCQTIDENDNEIDSYNMMVANQKRDRNKLLNELFYEQNFLMGTGVFVKKSIFSAIDKFNSTLIQSQDLEMWIRILTSGYKINIVSEKLIKYRIHNKNLSNNLNEPLKNITINSRYIFEIQKVLENYKNIKDFNFFIETFPNILKYPVIDEKYKDYYLMKEAFNVGMKGHGCYNIAYKLFACDLAYKIIHNKELYKEIDQIFGFDFKDFSYMLSQIINVDNIDYFSNINPKKIGFKNNSKKQNKIRDLFKFLKIFPVNEKKN